VSATNAFRAQMTQGGEALASALNATPPNFLGAQAALAKIRTQIPEGASDATVLDRGVLPDASLDVQATAAAKAVTLELVLTRSILPPSQIALAVQRQAEWISANAEPAVSGNSPLATLAELQATGDSMANSIAALSAIANLRAPELNNKVQVTIQGLTQALLEGTSPRNIVRASDVLIKLLGSLARPLEGFGRDALYQ